MSFREPTLLQLWRKRLQWALSNKVNEPLVGIAQNFIISANLSSLEVLCYQSRPQASEWTLRKSTFAKTYFSEGRQELAPLKNAVSCKSKRVDLKLKYRVANILPSYQTAFLLSNTRLKKCSNLKRLIDTTNIPVKMNFKVCQLKQQPLSLLQCSFFLTTRMMMAKLHKILDCGEIKQSQIQSETNQSSFR